MGYYTNDFDLDYVSDADQAEAREELDYLLWLESLAVLDNARHDDEREGDENYADEEDYTFFPLGGAR